MDSNIKVSVIVPVYNAEKYLRQCADSILAQSLSEIEVIFVDDGSTDSSYDILSEYEKKDERVSIIRQKNLYAGVARNSGKAIAKGKYLVFWDSDDYFDPDALKKMYDQCEKDEADICVTNANRYVEEKDEVVPGKYVNPKMITAPIPFNQKSEPEHILNFMTAHPWNKMFKKSFVAKWGIDFSPTRNGNDIYFVINSICLAERITIINESLMTYRVNQSASLFGTLNKSPLVPVKNWIAAAENLKKLNAFPERSFANKVCGTLTYFFHNLSDYEAYKSMFEFLQSEGLEKLSLKGHDKDYFYKEWHFNFIEHLTNDTAEEFLMFYFNHTYNQLLDASGKRSQKSLEIKDLKKEKKALASENKKLAGELKAKDSEISTLKKRIADLKSSMTYKIGSVITFVPRKLKK